MDRIKVLSLGMAKNEIKKPKGAISVQEYIERIAPDTYEFSKGYIEDAISEIESKNPQIVWIHQDGLRDYNDLIHVIKNNNPSIIIFIIIAGLLEDEQEIQDQYMESGAYKCYCVPPLMIDELVHDMYVALNME